MAKGKTKVKVKSKGGSQSQSGQKKTTVRPKVKIIASFNKDRK